jgi:hypothetical protein
MLKRDGVCNPVTHVCTLPELNDYTYPTQNFLNNGNIKRLERGYKLRPEWDVKKQPIDTIPTNETIGYCLTERRKSQLYLPLKSAVADIYWLTKPLPHR